MHGSRTDNDVADLCSRCAAGDEEAFSEVYRRFGGTLYATAWRILNSPQEAEEVVQEAFLILYRKAGEAAPRNLGGWLRRVTANRALDRLRQRTRRGEVELLDELHAGDDAARNRGAAQPGSAAPADAAAATLHGAGIDLRRALDELPERARMVFILHDVEGFKHREIGDLMGISDGSSKSQLFRARAKLRELLGPEAAP